MPCGISTFVLTRKPWCGPGPYLGDSDGRQSVGQGRDRAEQGKDPEPDVGSRGFYAETYKTGTRAVLEVTNDGT